MQGVGDYQRTYGAQPGQVRPDFFMDTIQDTRASLSAGREIFTEIERVRIIIPGMIASVVVKNVTDEHRQRWPELYAAFKTGQEAPLSGTPLEEWPVLNKAMVAELKHLQIRTVEELAALSDIAVQHIGMGGQILRERARVWLDDAAHEALTSKLAAENDVLRSQIAALEHQNEQLGEHLRGLSSRVHSLEDHQGGSRSLDYDDPVESAKQRAAAAPAPPASALDALAVRPMRRRGRGEDAVAEDAA